jgi:hypothetical protein
VSSKQGAVGADFCLLLTAEKIVLIFFLNLLPVAQMAELVDASDSKSGFSNGVQVRFLFWAQKKAVVRQPFSLYSADHRPVIFSINF